MIKLPDDLLIKSIESQKAYCDLKSFEQFTKKIKKKYKLAGNTINLPPAILLYPFFVLTSNKDACQLCLTVCIQKDDWEERESGHLEGVSYLDIKKFETLDKTQILEKMNDSGNGFNRVARLCNKKFNEVKDRQANLPQARFLLEKQSTIIQCALAEANDEILKKLKLI